MPATGEADGTSGGGGDGVPAVDLVTSSDALPDAPSDIDLQLRIDDVERSEARDSARWLALFAGVLGGLALAPGSPALTGLVFMLVMLVATGVGVFQVRRGQRKAALEQELGRRRASTLADADSPARRLVALHDELDRLDEMPTGLGEVVLLTVAACLFMPLGLSEGIAWVSSAGVFAGLLGLLRGRGVLARRRAKAELRKEIEQVAKVEEVEAVEGVEKIDEVEEIREIGGDGRRVLPSDSAGTGAGHRPPV